MKEYKHEYLVSASGRKRDDDTRVTAVTWRAPVPNPFICRAASWGYVQTHFVYSESLTLRWFRRVNAAGDVDSVSRGFSWSLNSPAVWTWTSARYLSQTRKSAPCQAVGADAALVNGFPRPGCVKGDLFVHVEPVTLICAKLGTVCGQRPSKAAAILPLQGELFV